ncbi:hypothetical protein AN958_03316 [Leucoagaricus sp. SymC.cos]|nr:hypothetical protein AN958_03316 [Leucoagaricus sp. SymC.cos]
MARSSCRPCRPYSTGYRVSTITSWFIDQILYFFYELIDETYGDVIMPPDNVYGLLFTGASTEQMNTSPYNSDPSLNINLGDLPNTSLPSDYGPELSNHETYYTLLGSLLVCELHPNVTGGRIRLSNDGTVDIITSGKPPIGNIPYNSTLKIISDVLQGSVRYFETSGQFGPSGTINDVVSYLFFGPNATWTFTAPPIHVPLDISSINTNLDKAMSSAVKAYVDRFKGPEL